MDAAGGILQGKAFNAGVQAVGGIQYTADCGGGGPWSGGGGGGGRTSGSQNPPLPVWGPDPGGLGETLGLPTNLPPGIWGIGGVFGLPDGCEFGSCGSVGFGWQQGSQWEIDKRPLSFLQALGNAAPIFHYFFYNPGTHESIGLGPGPGQGTGLFCAVPGKWEGPEQQGTLYESIPASMQSCVDSAIRSDINSKPPNYFLWNSYGQPNGTNCHGYVSSVLARCAY